MKKILAVSDQGYQIVHWCAIAVLFAMLTLFFVQTVLRFSVNVTLPWAEELCRYLFTWAVFLEGGIGVSKGIHVGFNLLSSRLTGQAALVVDAVVYVFQIVLGVVIIEGGLRLVEQTATQASPSMGFPMSYVYTALLVGGILIVLYGFVGLIRKLVEKE